MNTAIMVETPTVHVSVNKNRLKVYPEGYYLQNKQEFQLELHNPLQERILAEIYMNNVKIGGVGLILRPGERAFLERYIDSNRKFIFETYKVDDTETNLNAIKNNGNVEVRFYKEFQQVNYTNYTGTPYWSGTITTNPNPYNTFTTSTTSFICEDGNMSSNFVDSEISGRNFSKASTRSFTTNSLLNKPSDGILTGMVGKGNASNQKFENVSFTANPYPFHTAHIKLLPIENKVYSTDDIKVKRYCVECGSLVKPTFKFCSHCGSRI